MASVARAIEQAASKAVSGELWWEPHTTVFYELDNCGLVDAHGTVGVERGNSEGEAQLVSFANALNSETLVRGSLVRVSLVIDSI